MDVLITVEMSESAEAQHAGHIRMSLYNLKTVQTLTVSESFSLYLRSADLN